MFDQFESRLNRLAELAGDPKPATGSKSSADDAHGACSGETESRGLFYGRNVGLEKEGLRVQLSGSLAQTDHPTELGSALCNPYITTDYSEALLEVVTPALPSAREALHFLQQIHRFLNSRLPENEFMWGTSMPCVVDGAHNIRIGEYGNSNAGKMKHIYRRGLGLRYGKIMQTIAGIHFNFSWPQQFWDVYQESSGSSSSKESFVTESYFCMTRNLLRTGWLIPYLFGASPAICRTFLDGRDPLPSMSVHNQNTFYEPYGTSLRMGDIGYQYDKKSEASVSVDYSNLDSYLTDLLGLISQNHAPYEKLGERDAAGHWQQLNTNILQIENEYYSSVRPKQLVRANEPPLMAMHQRGILYLELRSLDIDVFEPAGLSTTQLDFLEAFMLYAQIHESPVLSTEETRMINANMTQVAHSGRQPGLKLQRPDGDVTLKEWAEQVLHQIGSAASLLDSQVGTDRYSQAVTAQLQKVADPALTPSARIVDEMLNSHPSFYDMAKSHSHKHADVLAAEPVDEKIEQLLHDSVGNSIEKQQQMETNKEGSLESYLQTYFDQLGSTELDRYRKSETPGGELS